LTAQYILLAEKVIKDIENNVLAIGQRMPAIRKFSKLYGVSITTVNSCYHLLQEQGWLQAKAQSGFFVSQPFGEKMSPQFPSFKTSITQLNPQFFSQPFIQQSTEQNRNIENVTGDKNCPLFTALIAPELLPLVALNRCHKRATMHQTHELYNYPNSQGLPRLRKNLSAHFTSQHFHLNPEKLVITNGCIDAIKTAIEVTTSPGDVVAISSPCFNGLLDLLANMNRAVIELPFHQGQLDLVQLEQHLVKKTIKACLFSANHINPQGICLSPQQKQKLAELAEHYQIPIIEDDVYLELSHTSITPLPIKHWDKSGWVLWCGAISKTIAPSYRLGWCEPGLFFEKYLNHRSVQYSGVNNFVQKTMSEFIYSGQYLKHIKTIKVKLSQNTHRYHQILQKYLPINARISTPLGGLVLWLQIPNLDSQVLLKTAKLHNINFRIGNEFSSLGLYKDCFRINIGWPIALNDPILDEEHSQEHKLRTKVIKLCQLINQQLAP